VATPAVKQLRANHQPTSSAFLFMKIL